MELSQTNQRPDLTGSEGDKENARQVSIGSSVADSGVADLSQRSSFAKRELESALEPSGSGPVLPNPVVSDAVVSEPTASNSEPKPSAPVFRFRRFYRALRSRQVRPSPPVTAVPVRNLSPERFWADQAYISDDERYLPAQYGDRPREETLSGHFEDYLEGVRQCRAEYFAARKEKRTEKTEEATGSKLRRVKARMSSLNLSELIS
jgi:hypothetical protein